VLKLAGLLIGVVARLWVSTLRVRVVAERATLDGPRVFAFWHGRQFALLGAALGRRTVALVSRSRDGEMQAHALRRFGIRAVRGSSSRHGAAGQRALVRALRAGLSALYAVDGPRGPAFVVKPGAEQAARLAGVPLVAVASAISSGFSFRRAWDGFVVPWPFARVVLVFEPTTDLVTGLSRAEVRAWAELGGTAARPRAPAELGT